MFKIFGTDGVRCRVNEEPMTPDTCLKIAKTVTYEGYRLYYLQHALQELKMDLTNAPNTKSNTKALTLDQEFEANALIAKRGNIAVEPQEAWVTGNSLPRSFVIHAP